MTRGALERRGAPVFAGAVAFAVALAAGAESARAQDPADPLPPTAVSGASSYSTPTSILLTWTDPTTRVDGSPLLDFSIVLQRDGGSPVNVEQGVGAFTDFDLVEGRQYEYTLRTRDDGTDSLSVPVAIFVFAGGSPTPAPPTGASCNPDSFAIALSWTNPTTQDDGSPLDDFAGVRIYRGGQLLAELPRTAADTGSADGYVDDATLPGLSYDYTVAAIDAEIPMNESDQVPVGPCVWGTIPPILLWKPSDVISSSPSTMHDVLETLGETCWLTNDLFAFGPDLSGHEIVYAFAGIYPNNHHVTDAEGEALEGFTFSGGRLLLECGDCLNYDPEAHDTYDLRGLFGLSDGPDGSSDLFYVEGLNDLAGYSFQYLGPNRFIDELVPSTSIPLLKNAANLDVSSVFQNRYGAGRAIAFTFEAGHLVDVPQAGASNEKTALFADCLRLLRETTPPILVTGTTAVVDTLIAGDSTTAEFSLSNPGSINADLLFTIGEEPESEWLVVSPVAGAVPGNESVVITTTLDARVLTPGDYAAILLVAANDSANAADTVAVALHVLPAPDLLVSPDSLAFRVAPNGGTDVDSLALTNTGGSTLFYSLAIDPGGAERLELPSEDASFLGGGRYRGNVYRADVATEIRRIDHLASVDPSTTMEFFVYESFDSSGVYTKIHSNSIAATVGTGWQTSGPVDVPVAAGRYYFVGAGWQGSLTYFSDASGTALPLSVPFGACLGSAGSNAYPPPPSKALAPAPSLNSQAIEFGETADIVLLSTATGSLLPSESTWAVLKATGHDLTGVFPATLQITSNDPLASIETVRPVPVSVLVDAATGAPSVAPASPANYALAASAPNPFRSATTIRFATPRAERITLRIYDLAGRLVRTLVEGRLEAGLREALWDGRDEAGRSVASGIYFCMLEAPEETLRRKLVRLR